MRSGGNSYKQAGGQSSIRWPAWIFALSVVILAQAAHAASYRTGCAGIVAVDARVFRLFRLFRLLSVCGWRWLRFGWRQPCALYRRRDELAEERMRACGPTLELWVELRADEPGMIFQFNDLDQAAICGLPAERHASSLHWLAIAVVELIAVAMALEDDRLAIRRLHLAPRRQAADPLAQPHRATLIGDVALVQHQINHLIMRIGIEL